MKIGMGAIIAAMLLNACSSGKSAGGSSESTAPNIYGQVSQSTTVSNLAPGQLHAAAVSGCTMNALDILTNAQVSTTTSASDGTYTMTGLQSGVSYKISANCGASEKYTSIAKADTTASSKKTPESTSPVSTIIATKIMQAVLSAVETSTASLPADTAAAVKAAVLKGMDSVIATLKATIEEAISSGAMQAPSVSEAATLSGTLETATTSTSVNTATTTYETNSGKNTPASVNQSVEGAKNQVAALTDCDHSLGSEANCQKAIAKIIYNTLSFPVVLKTAGIFSAVFTSGGGCVQGNNDLAALFPNASVVDGGTMSMTGYCVLQPKLGRVNRNRGDSEGSDGGGIGFAETGAGGSSNVGVISALGTALFNNYNYNPGNLDQILFGYNGTNIAGMNARMFNVNDGTGSAGSLPAATMRIMAGDGSWNVVPQSLKFRTTSVSNCTSFDCQVAPSYPDDNYLNIPTRLNAKTWAGADLDSGLTAGVTELTGLVNAINAGNYSGMTLKIYGGALPSLAQIDTFLDEETHIRNNPTGSKKMQVIYAQRPLFEAGSNGCNDVNSADVCKGADGTPYPALRVNVAVSSTALSGSVIHPISGITVPGSAADANFVMYPYYDFKGFNGVISFRKIADGRTFSDELQQERAIKLILNTTTDCNVHGIPTTGSGCAVGKAYNVALNWTNCSSSLCPSYTALSTTAITTSFTLSSMIQTNYKTMGAYLGSTNFQVWIAAYGDYSSLNPLRVNAATTASAIDVLSYSQSGTYGIVPRFTGCPTNCAVANFYLIDMSTGIPRPHSADVESGTETTNICGLVSGQMTCTDGTFTAATYTATQLDAMSGFPGGTFSTNVANQQIFSGPFVNPNFRCDKEPYFIDGNGDGKLNCDPNDASQVLASSSDVSFSQSYQYSSWYNSPSTSTAMKAKALMIRANGYAFGDPVGARKLLTTAFNGWFDGAHSIAADTNLNALQVLGLVFLTFSRENGVNVNIAGLASDHFTLQMPSDTTVNNNGGNAILINQLLGQGFLTMKQ